MPRPKRIVETTGLVYAKYWPATYNPFEIKKKVSVS
tara:strand:+ start:1095 stop:1202 length:108 start_codon:yes stop_codon:yes gene_type:complete